MDLTNATTIQGQSLQKVIGTKQLQNSNSIASLKNGIGQNGGTSLAMPGISQLQLQPKTTLTGQANYQSNNVSHSQLQKIKSKGNISVGQNGGVPPTGASSLKQPLTQQTYNVMDEAQQASFGGPAYISYDMKIGDVSKYNFRGASGSHAGAGSQSQASILGRGSSQEQQVESGLMGRRISQQKGATDENDANFASQLSKTHEAAKRS